MGRVTGKEKPSPPPISAVTPRPVIEGELASLAKIAVRMAPRTTRNPDWGRIHAEIDRLLVIWQRAR